MPSALQPAMEGSTATADNCLYETLGSLSSPLSGYSNQSSEHPQSVEHYSVFRNEISLSSPDLDSVAAAAPDFFSLDVDDEAEFLEQNPAPSPFREPAREPPQREDELPRFEGGWFGGNSRFKSPLLQLHKEILDFSNFLSPTPEEQATRNSAVESVFGVIKYIWPNCTVEVFGSFQTELYLPTSDIDVVIFSSGIQSPQLGLYALSRALSQKCIAKKIQVIAKARVPIIKFIEKKSGVSFDISFDVQNGPAAAEYIKGVLSKCPSIRPLCLILKVFLQQRELNEVYSGGIGSYALLTMIMVLLRTVRERQVSPEHNLGVLLIHFFDFYGLKLNTSDVGISCREGGTFFLKSSRGFVSNNKGRPVIAIEDPQAPENDIGKNSFNYSQIRSAFQIAFNTLTSSKILTSLGPNRSILGTIIRPDPVLLKRKGGCNGDVTFESLLPGAGEPLERIHGNGQDIFCNWQWDDEELLPRGGSIVEPTSSSKRKRKSSTSRKSSKKAKTDSKDNVRKHGEDGTKQKTPKKKKLKTQANGSGARHHRHGSSYRNSS
ncbi:hypothetical protein SAY86_004009 [Trapa natans]|uniref:polynucleotide adenylyltransferase n=1 Tax=Trapa natans TaxID=22666 RepID=A0AAN7MF47_TRANT|nr:hypothetical protein SAY86_004009 [Trapa natans]